MRGHWKVPVLTWGKALIKTEKLYFEFTYRL